MEIHLSICIFVFGILWKSYFVQCSDNIRDNSLRLVHPVVESAGRVEIYHEGTWGTVCDNGWGFSEAEVVCNQLGYPGAYSAVEDAYFGPGTGPIMLDGVYCKGMEHYLAECRHDGWYDHNCNHNEDAGVYCNLPNVHYPRLINGYTYYEGRLEIWNGIQWVKICSNSIFSESEGYTVCKQLGYNGLDKIFNDDRFGEGNAPPATWGYSCSINDESLLQCGVYPYNGSSCAATNVRCQNVTDDYLSGGAIAGIVIGVMMFFGFCLFSCIAVYTRSKAQKRKRGNSLEVANVGEATNTSGSTPSEN